ncbi:MAG: glycosyltransferase family 2 protein [Candidatus Methanosuratincola sp.]
MIKFFGKFTSFFVISILLVFTVRRLLFAFTILFLGERKKDEKILGNQDFFQEVIILIPCRDEAEMIPGLCRSLIEIDYPVEKYRVVLIDDGSTDGTGDLMKEYAEERPGWYVLSLPGNTGKASALNNALARFPFGEIIFVLDADHRPRPDILKKVIRYFDDPEVAGVSGYTKVSNPTASPSAYYSTVESSINQLVTMRAKDRLGLAPALLGSNCGYRRTILEQCSGYREGAFSEDSDLTVAFYNAGYKVRFAEDVISFQQVPQSIRGYLKQHIRWGRGLNDVARVHSREIIRNPRLPLPLRLELLIFASGYLDRLALAAAGLLTGLAQIRRDLFTFPYQVIIIALLTPLAQIIALFAKEKVARTMWVRLPVVPLFFLLDIYAAARSLLDTFFNPSRVWTKTERVIPPQHEDDLRLYR